MIYFVVVLVFLLGDASARTATALECQHDDTSHSDKDVGLPSVWTGEDNEGALRFPQLYHECKLSLCDLWWLADIPFALQIRQLERGW